MCIGSGATIYLSKRWYSSEQTSILSEFYAGNPGSVKGLRPYKNTWTVSTLHPQLRRMCWAPTTTTVGWPRYRRRQGSLDSGTVVLRAICIANEAKGRMVVGLSRTELIFGRRTKPGYRILWLGRWAVGGLGWFVLGVLICVCPKHRSWRSMFYHPTTSNTRR